MQFSLTAAILAITTLAAAAPQHANGKWPIPSSMTVKEGQSKCGDQAQLSCCNKATYAHDTTDINSGILGGALSNLVGSGSGAQGLGLFDQCSELNVQVAAAIGVPVQNLLNQVCKQNIACCANSPSTASNDLVGAGLPCVALGSVL